MKIKRVGVIGGGQLAGMMGEAAKKLGVDLFIQTQPGNWLKAVTSLRLKMSSSI